MSFTYFTFRQSRLIANPLFTEIVVEDRFCFFFDKTDDIDDIINRLYVIMMAYKQFGCEDDEMEHDYGNPNTKTNTNTIENADRNEYTNTNENTDWLLSTTS